MSFDVGDLWTPELTVKNAAGALTAATVTLSVTSPAGTVSSPTVSTPSVGLYTASVPLTETGYWLATWTVTGTVTGVESQQVYARRYAVSATLSEIKAALNKTLTVDDAELDRMLDAAVTEYEELVGPFGQVTEKHSGGRGTILLNSPLARRITAAAYDDGTVIDVADLDLDVGTGILHWGYNTAGVFTYGSRNVTVTYTVNLPANHREAIIADVAGLFAATQRGNSPGALPVGYDAVYQQQEVSGSGPVTLFPRIKALAARYPSIA